MKEHEYEYIDPTEIGYIKTRVKLKHLRGIGINTGSNRLFTKADVYYSAGMGCYLIQYTGTLLAKAMTIGLAPIIFIAYGLANYKGVYKEIRNSIFDKKYGAMRQDMCYIGDSYHISLSEIHYKLEKV